MTDPVTTLEDLLSAEGQALAAGDLSAVADAVDAKLSALAMLQGTMACLPALERLRDEARRVEALLEASLQGIAAAHHRLGALEQVRSELTTYDSQGLRASIPAAPKGGGFERKA